METLKKILDLGFQVRLYPVLPSDRTYYMAVSHDAKNGCGRRAESITKVIEECYEFIMTYNKF